MQIKETHITIKYLIFGTLLVGLQLMVACNSEGIYQMPPSEVKKPAFQNTPQGKNMETLRILAIGNSYSYDGTAYISELLDSAHIERSRYCVKILSRGGASLKYWADELTSNKEHGLYGIAGDLRIHTYKATLPQLLAQHWDVIVLQQMSRYAVDYNTYNPSLQILVDSIQKLCTNPNVTLAWQLIHTYGKDSKYNEGLVGYERWEKIANATRIMIENNGIDIVIPTGTAIQQARQTELETSYDLTRDNTHLCYGVGRYIAACCWVETLFRPAFGVSIQGNTANHALTDAELHDSEVDFIPESSVPVTEQNREQCQQCALDAFKNPYKILTTGNTTGI